MSLVLLQTAGAVTTLTLNRPGALNAMNEAMAAEFEGAVARAGRAKSKVVVLRGAGPAFSAGGDLAFIEANMKRPRAALAPLMRRFYGSFLSLRDLPQVTVADLHGTAVGAGLCLALACDMRVAAPAAKLAFNFVRLGLNPGMAAWPLARAVLGEARARELLFTGRSFTGRDLVNWGGALSSDERSAAELARQIAEGSSDALRALKVETRVGEDLAPYLAREAAGQAATFKGKDLAEGVAAVRARRPPRF